MKDNEKLAEGEITPKSEFGKKLDNFWYYHKWKVICAVLVLFVVVVCLVQCLSRETYDISLIYGGAMSASDERVLDMKSALNEIRPESIGNDGVGLAVMEIYDEEYAQEQGSDFNSYVNVENYNSLCHLITTGEYSILILDSWIYDDIKGNLGFRAIDEICGEGIVSQDQKYDATAVYFKKTAFYGSNAGAFSGVSDDAVICLAIYSPFRGVVGCGGAEPTDRAYENSVEMFKSILTYKSK